MYDQLKLFIRSMFSTPAACNNSPCEDTSSSSSSSACSSVDFSEDDSSQQPEHLSPRTHNGSNSPSVKRLRRKKRKRQPRLHCKLTQLTNANEILRAKIEMLTRKFGHADEKEDGQLPNDEPRTIVTSISNSICDSDDPAPMERHAERLPTAPVQRHFVRFNRALDL